ncbi:MAG: DNA gyrase inhibitor YacG [Pyrinomonadaceae bacterium]|nr:DNA gyrase inhibitor YacG [Pyrinomonadaceae bacterium]
MPIVKCPRCSSDAEYEGNEFRPFCSERCKLLDFGAWADGQYALAAESAGLTIKEIEELEDSAQ